MECGGIAHFVGISNFHEESDDTSYFFWAIYVHIFPLFFEAAEMMTIKCLHEIAFW